MPFILNPKKAIGLAEDEYFKLMGISGEENCEKFLKNRKERIALTDLLLSHKDRTQLFN